MDFLQGLNPQQREAVIHTEGPLLILAGAGSGKTRVITHRIAHLVSKQHIPPSAILAVTFTNKAADEMRTRVAGLLESENLSSAPNLSTFHSFCVRLLRRDGDPLAQVRPGFTRRFSIYDDEDQLAIVKAAFRHLGLDEKFMQYRAVLSRISHAKNHKKTPQELYQAATEPILTKIAVIYEEYEKALRQSNALDFDDLLLETVRLLYHDEATREGYNRRLSYIMIDEYQDTNRTQYELMRLLTQSHQNVCVVGDEDQSIYSWRGADIHNILDFERDFPNALTIRLEQTKNARASGSGPKPMRATCSGSIPDTMRRTKHCSSPTPSNICWPRILTSVWPFFTAPTFSHVKSKKPCGATAENMSSWADSVSINAPKSRTSSRT